MGRIRGWRLGAIVAAVVIVVVGGVVLLVSDDGDSGGPSTAIRATATTTSVADTVLDTATTNTAQVTPQAGPSSTATPATTARAPRPTAPPSTAAPAPAAAPARCPTPTRGSDFDGFGAEEIVIDTSQGAYRSCVLTADTPEQRQQGLMRQDDLDGYGGMIFRFEQEQELTFWMRNTRIPLSIAFFSASGSFVSSADMEPCGDSPDCPRYTSGGPAMYALEVQQGGLPAVGAIPGSRLHA